MRNRLFPLSAVCFALALGFAGPSKAQTSKFNLTYSGPTFSGNILLTGTPNGDGTFTVTAASGSQAVNGGTLTVTGVVPPTASYGTESLFYIAGTSSYFGYDDVLTPATLPYLVVGGGLLLTFSGVPTPVLLLYDPTGKYGDGVGYQEAFYVGMGGNDALDPAFTDYPITTLTLTPVEPPIAAVEFTQAIQQYQSLSNLESSLQANGEPPVPIISGKPAVMRIYYNPPAEFTGYALTVTGAASDSETMALLPGCEPLAQRARTAPCYATDVFFTPPSGSWTVNILLNDSRGNPVDQEALTVKSRDTETVNLAAVRVCEFSEPLLPPSSDQIALGCGSPGVLQQETALLSSILPTNNLKVSLTGRDFFYQRDISIQYQYWSGDVALNLPGFYSAADKAADLGANQQTVYVGVAPRIPVSSSYSFFHAPGSSSAPAAEVPQSYIVGFELSNPTDATQQTVAREVGAALGDSYTNVVPQLLKSILDFTPPGCWDTATNPSGVNISPWPYDTNNIQSSQGLEYGYDVTNLAVIDPNNTFDIGTYCYPTWIAPFDYKELISSLGGGYSFSPSIARATSSSLAKSTAAVQPKAQLTLAQGAYMQVGGTIAGTAVSFNPIFTEMMNGSTDPSTGTYSIVEQNSTGQALYTRFFTPSVITVDSSDAEGDVDTTVQGPSGFSEWIPQTPGTATIAVLDSSANLLGSVAVTGTAPVVSITAPAAGFTGSGVQAVSWTIQDPTATSFFSRIFYSIDQGATWTLVGNSQVTGGFVDFDNLPGGASALIRVDVSDGVNTGSAVSAPFSVPKKVPASVVINAPATGAIRVAAKPVYLTGAAYDPDDGSLTGTSLAWNDNVEGALGTGSPLAVTLKPGPHTITLTATDSDGNAISTTTRITVAGAAPVVTVTANTLLTNCVSATIGAAPGNQGLALSTVQYSLNGGGTYTSIPLSALPYSFVVPGSSAVNVLAYATDASGQMGAQSAPVALTGACAAGVPKYFGGSPQTTTVGSAFTTPLSAVVTDVNGDPVAGASVNFTAPTTGASATITPATAISGSNGVATAAAKADGTNGSYTVVASVAGFSTTAQFNLTNTDFSLALSDAMVTVQHGSSATVNVTISPLSGFNSTVAFGCAGLPNGVTCTFSPTSVTPNGAPVTGVVTINAASNATSSSAMLKHISAGGIALALCLLVPGLRRRGRRFGVFMLLALAFALVSANGCGGSFHSFTSSVTVNATSGSLTHSSSVSLSVQ